MCLLAFVEPRKYTLEHHQSILPVRFANINTAGGSFDQKFGNI